MANRRCWPTKVVKVNGKWITRPVVFTPVFVFPTCWQRLVSRSSNKLHGSALVMYIVARALEGYTVVFSLGELDPALNGNEIIVADTIGGKPLNSNQGPFQVMVPGDKRPARWIRMLTDLEVMSAPVTPEASHP